MNEKDLFLLYKADILNLVLSDSTSVFSVSFFKVVYMHNFLSRPFVGRYNKRMCLFH